MAHLLFVTSSLQHGGAERHTITLLNRLGERGHDVHLAYVKEGSSQLGRLRLPAKSTVRCLHAQRHLDWAAVAELARAIADLAPNVIVAANEYALLYATLARWRAGVRCAVVVTWHAMRAYGAKEQLKLALCRPLFWAARCAVFVCEAQRRRWRSRALFARRNEIIYNGVNVDEFVDRSSADERRARRRALRLADSDYVIGITAALRPEKNHVQLVDAVALLRALGFPARALLIGDGEMRAAIEAHARLRGISEHVLITGYQADVRPFVSAADVVVLCSVTEALSLAALEAMALGLPVVHSDVGGAAELITPRQNGFLFPPHDTVALVEKLADLADTDTRCAMGRNARAAVVRSFAENVMVDAYERLLVDLARVTEPVPVRIHAE